MASIPGKSVECSEAGPLEVVVREVTEASPSEASWEAESPSEISPDSEDEEAGARAVGTMPDTPRGRLSPTETGAAAAGAPPTDSARGRFGPEEWDARGDGRSGAPEEAEAMDVGGGGGSECGGDADAEGTTSDESVRAGPKRARGLDT